MENVLFLTTVEEGALTTTALEALAAAKTLGNVTVGLIGADVKAAADSIANSGAVKILAATGEQFAHARYSTDAAAAEAIVKAAAPAIVVIPASSRNNRFASGVAHRTGGVVDTHITAVSNDGGVKVSRWFYRQRMEAQLSRTARPWFLVVESGVASALTGAAGSASVEAVAVNVASKTTVQGVRAPKSDEQTIRPEAKLLFVAGAGWTKKQADGQIHGKEAESIILGFLKNSKASLGGSKSLVDQSGEGEPILGFMTHLNQVGQTGSTPRHPKGLSTCCHEATRSR